MVSVDYILQHLPYVVPPYVHMLQKLLFKYAVYPFGNSVVTWVVPFRHAYPGAPNRRLWLRAVWISAAAQVSYRDSKLGSHETL